MNCSTALNILFNLQEFRTNHLSALCFCILLFIKFKKIKKEISETFDSNNKSQTIRDT